MDHDRRQVREVIARGVSAWDRDDFDAALEVFSGVLAEHPGFADVHNKAGLCLAMLGRFPEALEHFDAALGINRTYAEAHLNRGIMLQELGRAEEAQEAFVKAGELDTRDSRAFPSDVGNRIAVTHAQLGDLYLVADHPREAAAHYEAALAIRPRFLDIRSKFAEALVELGEMDRALEELRHILENRPGFVGARIRLGVVYHRLGRNEDAISEWQRCAAEDPEDMRPRAYLASVGVNFPAVASDGPDPRD
ncbi:MAG: tetratricopeptide repeat protein [Gemmatimonadota bacterium]|nr:tetratricopeptide repeat protein [Gemmatimonadota bacterium]